MAYNAPKTILVPPPGGTGFYKGIISFDERLVESDYNKGNLSLSALYFFSFCSCMLVLISYQECIWKLFSGLFFFY